MPPLPTLRKLLYSKDMAPPESSIRNISDTARWVAVYRARESKRSDAVFHDPFAGQLAGDRGNEIAAAMPFAEKNSWPFVARTWLTDRLINEQVRNGADMVVNLAAGLDARPYRLDLPATLQWVEVDLPEILTHKEQVLKDERPACALERVKMDLSNVEARRQLFAELGRRAENVVVVSEGLLVYLTEQEVTGLASDLAAPASFQRWVIDLTSPALLRMLSKKLGAPLDQAGIPLKFAPQAGPGFFTNCGWKPEEVHSVIHAAAEIKRLPLFLKLISAISPTGFRANRPWSGVCLLGKERRT